MKRWIKVLLLLTALLSLGATQVGTFTLIYETTDTVLIKEIVSDRHYQFLFYLSGDYQNAIYFQGRGDHALQQLNELYSQWGWGPVEF